MNYSSLNLFDTVNGPGVRVSLFVSGCTLNCPGCFNKPAQNFRNGSEYTPDIENTILDALAQDGVRGLSLLGGDPLEPKNFGAVLQLCKKVKTTLPQKDIWVWTGRTIEEVNADPQMRLISMYVDVLVEGRFVESLKDSSLRHRGSSNQRVINLHTLLQ